MDLSSEQSYQAFYSCITVFSIQGILIAFVFSTIFDRVQGGISYPGTLQTLVARFLCTILMHWQVEGDERQGLKIMKFVVTNPSQFIEPWFAFFVGLMQFTGGIACEIICTGYLSTINSTIDVIIRFIALGSIAKVDDFYAGALPGENKLNGDTTPFKREKLRRDYGWCD